MIEIVNLKKSFGQREIFHDFSAQIETGAFAVLRGKSGCGKSTLLHMIGCIEKPDGGRILLDGRDVHRQFSHKEYFGKRVGFVFQNFALMENETVLKNLMLVPKSNRADVSVQEALNEVMLPDCEEKKVYQLSGGEQQRVALARLMIKKCDIVLADEPTGSLDADSAAMVVEILKRMNKKGKTVVVVTHAEIFQDAATQVLYLKDHQEQDLT